MARQSTGRMRIDICPHCDEELMDMGYDKRGNYYEKHCPKCDRIFRRIRGYGHKWYIIDEMEI
jgi:phage FluMu protein Com